MNIVRVAECMHDVLKVVYRLGWRTNLSKTSRCLNAIVMGNGPSLAKMISMHPNGIPDHDIFCVNSFPKTDAFLRFRPKYCVFADPGYWSLSASDDLKNDRNIVFKAINDSADWDVCVLFPAVAKNSHSINALEFSNPNVTISYYNSTTISDALPLWLRSYIYRHHFAIAGLQTVTCGALSLAISMGYTTINLAGADASFLEDVTIDDERNVLVTRDCHYYDNGHVIPKPIFADVEQTVPMKACEYLDCIAKMFKGFRECALFASALGIKVINSSDHSWIDSFDRGVI